MVSLFFAALTQLVEFQFSKLAVAGSSPACRSMINIKILGACGSGKTTIAIAIEQFLRDNNFTDVSVNDTDIDCGTDYRYLQPLRLNAISNTPIRIETLFE